MDLAGESSCRWLSLSLVYWLRPFFLGCVVVFFFVEGTGAGSAGGESGTGCDEAGGSGAACAVSVLRVAATRTVKGGASSDGESLYWLADDS